MPHNVRAPDRPEDAVLVERASEAEKLAAAIRGVEAGDGRLVLVEGPPGIGKTRLLDAAQELSAAAGFAVLSASGSELEAGFPFGVARQLFERRLSSTPAPERAVLLDGAAAPAADDQGRPPAAGRGSARELRRRSGGPPRPWAPIRSR